MTAAAQPVVKVSSTAVFQKRDFVLMWVAQLVSTAGSSLTDLAAGDLRLLEQTGRRSSSA